MVAKIGVDTGENEPLEVWGENSIQYSIVSLVETVSAPISELCSSASDVIQRVSAVVCQKQSGLAEWRTVSGSVAMHPF